MTNPTNLVQETKRGNIALVTIDNPPINALSKGVRQGLMERVISANKDPKVDAIVIACAGNTFVAGADITEFSKPPMEPHLPEVLAVIESSGKPVITALHGTVLGGGFELALASHYRVALEGTKVGLPEVTLGLIPGAGGTQRLPRLVGLETSLDIITSGKPVTTQTLADSGVFDQIVKEALLEQAIQFAQHLIDRGVGPRPLSEVKLDKNGDEPALFELWREKLAKRARGQLAPQRAIASIENTITLTFAEGMQKEREYFLECRQSPQSRAMRHAFFAERQAAKLPGIDRSMTPLTIKRVGVIGAGTMGSSIAMCFASAGFEVVLLEMAKENLQRGLASIEKHYQGSVEKSRITNAEKQACLARISGTCEYNDLADVDLVVEAAFENTQVKQDVFTRLDKVCRSDTILTTNTSYLDIDEIAAVTHRPARILGMHFFSPANVMKLLEVVCAEQTSDQTLVTAMAVGKRIGKIAVPVRVCYGFVGNRMYSCYGREANSLLLEGATPSQIDAAMTDWGMAMGPLAVADMSGLDIGYKARRERPGHGEDPAYFKAADLMVELGRLGQKTGMGFYRYDPDTGKRQEDQQVIQIFRQAAEQLQVTQRELQPTEIQDRLIFSLINEGAKILEEDIASRAGDIDVIWLNGYGFPRFRGGPMHYADEVGLGQVLERIQQFREQSGSRYWQPAPLLEKLVHEGVKLASWSNK